MGGVVGWVGGVGGCRGVVVGWGGGCMGVVVGGVMGRSLGSTGGWVLSGGKDSMVTSLLAGGAESSVPESGSGCTTTDNRTN